MNHYWHNGHSHKIEFWRSVGYFALWYCSRGSLQGGGGEEGDIVARQLTKRCFVYSFTGIRGVFKFLDLLMSTWGLGVHRCMRLDFKKTRSFILMLKCDHFKYLGTVLNSNEGKQDDSYHSQKSILQKNIALGMQAKHWTQEEIGWCYVWSIDWELKEELKIKKMETVVYHCSIRKKYKLSSISPWTC